MCGLVVWGLHARRACIMRGVCAFARVVRRTAAVVSPALWCVSACCVCAHARVASTIVDEGTRTWSLRWLDCGSSCARAE